MRLPKISESAYINLTLAAFVFSPELRRLVDWRGNFDPLNIFTILPIVMLLPIFVFVYKRRAAISGTPFATVALIWTIAFAYSFVVGAAQGAIIPGLFDLGLFVLPIAIGAWIVASPEALHVHYKRLSTSLFVYGAIAGAYGIVQYVFAPPWDTEWMINIGSTAFGQPAPFAIRVFSVLNGPGVYAQFTAFCLILTLPRLRLRRPWTVVAALLMTTGLLLSLVRTAWIAIILGAIFYAIVSPRRVKAVISLLCISALFIAAGTAFFTLVPSDNVRDQLSDRIATLGDVSTDPSALERENTSSIALASGLANPLGHGLGLTGAGAALASPELLTRSDLPDSAIDNGFLVRFVEMGYPGLAGFLGSIFYAILITFRRLRSYRSGRDPEAGPISAASLSVQFASVLILASGDVYLGVGSVMLFISLALGTKLPHKAAPAAHIEFEVPYLPSNPRRLSVGSRKARLLAHWND